MPRATSNVDTTEKFDLKTLEDGYVVLRRMTYGQKLARQEQATRMTMPMKGGKNADPEMEIALMGRQSTYLEFAQCVADHNLEDENGVLLNFTKTSDVDRLDPRVGEEISILLSQMNNFEEDLGN